jgi:hypothetical protein
MKTLLFVLAGLAAAAFGALALANFAFDSRSVRTHTIDGTVREIVVTSHSGDVELVLPAAIGAELDLESREGMVSVAIPAKTPKPMKGKTIFFANAGGGAQIVVRSFKGRVQVFGQ